jgi:Uncharacterized protein conserved in bacteria
MDRDQLISSDPGATLVHLCETLFTIVFAFTLIRPFLTDSGIMEFLGVIARPLVRPLFHVPVRASIDLMASWFGASNATVIRTREQYMKGFYTRREPGYIRTKLLCGIHSVLSDGSRYHGNVPIFSLHFTCASRVLGIIPGRQSIARIPPICTIPNTYREAVGKQIDEDIPQAKWDLCLLLWR